MCLDSGDRETTFKPKSRETAGIFKTVGEGWGEEESVFQAVETACAKSWGGKSLTWLNSGGGVRGMWKEAGETSRQQVRRGWWAMSMIKDLGPYLKSKGMTLKKKIVCIFLMSDMVKGLLFPQVLFGKLVQLWLWSHFLKQFIKPDMSHSEFLVGPFLSDWFYSVRWLQQILAFNSQRQQVFPL